MTSRAGVTTVGRNFRPQDGFECSQAMLLGSHPTRPWVQPCEDRRRGSRKWVPAAFFFGASRLQSGSRSVRGYGDDSRSTTAWTNRA